MLVCVSFNFPILYGETLFKVRTACILNSKKIEILLRNYRVRLIQKKILLFECNRAALRTLLQIFRCLFNRASMIEIGGGWPALTWLVDVAE